MEEEKMKKLIIFGLAGLFMVLCALTILSQAREKMKVVCWGPHRYDSLDSTYWRNFSQIDSCFMNMLRVGTFKANEDFDSAKHYGFELVENFSPKTSLVTGQQSTYEADDHHYLHLIGFTPTYFFDGYFDHSNSVGIEKYDFDALNGYAWYADPDSDDAGYVLRDLKAGYIGYNNEQWIPHEYRYGNPVDTITFYADFLIKISDTTYQADPFLILKAIRIDEPDTFLLDSLVIRPQDFDYPNQYDTFHLTFTRAKLDSGYLDYTVWWDGSRAVWIDRVKIRDAFADSLFRGLYDAWINSLNADGRDTLLTAWYLVDQPDDDQYDTQAYLHAYLNSNQYPFGVQSLQVYFHKVDEYLSVVNPKELWFNQYVLEDDVDTATTGGNLQTSLSNLAGCLNFVKQKAISHGKPFLYIAQAYMEEGRRRYPTEFEQKVLAWLGLAYGANGIAYFTYATRDGIKGLVDSVAGYYEPHEPNWSAVQSVNVIIDSIGWLFADTSSWKGAGGGDTVASIPASFIDSLKSAEFDSPWIEVGFFQDSAQTNYFMLVNRRCLSTEEQNVTVYMDSVKIGSNKMWYVIDQYSQDTTFTGAINGIIPFTTHLDPGQGKLFKLVAFPDSAFHGTAHPLTWQGGIMVDGDVTVDSGIISVSLARIPSSQ